MEEKVLSVNDLHVSFKTDRGIVKAVRGVSFDLYKGETLCIVGESGSGKSVTNKAIMGISAKNAIIESGSILYEGEDLTKVSEEEFHRIRGHKIGMIFQDPLSALNPVMKIGKQITEATLVNRNILKRRYEELIANDLIRYRNNFSNTEFNINKLESYIEQNEKTIKKFGELSKKVSKIDKKLANPDLQGEKSIELNDLKANLENEIADLVSSNVDFYDFLMKDKTNEIDSLKDKLEKLSKKTFDNEVYKNINDDEIKFINDLLEFYKKDFVVFKKDNVSDSLKVQNEIFKELIKVYKLSCKAKKQNLKVALNNKKKEAKAEVDKYYLEIKKVHDDKMTELNTELLKIEEKMKSVLSSLSEDERSELLSDIKFNKVLKEKEKKFNKKTKEMNLSKVTKREVNYKELKNHEYAELLKEKEALEIKIEEEKADFVNKTKVTKAEAKKMALEVMKEVGIPLPEKRFKQYPFEFSGGMRQRIVIAIALTANPDILICDEPTTALDVTIQAQILDLINKLKEERHLSCIFITHDLGVVAHMADRVAVMYAGRIVEYGKVDEIFYEPKHPYTWALLSSIPDINSKEKLEAIPGTPPDMLFPPKGDAFALRSKYAMAIDFKYQPPFFKVSDTHYAATWLLAKGAPSVKMPAIVEKRIEEAKKRMKEEK